MQIASFFFLLRLFWKMSLFSKMAQEKGPSFPKRRFLDIKLRLDVHHFPVAFDLEPERSTVGPEPAAELWRDLLELAVAGLERWEPGSSRFLDVLREDAEAARCPADHLRSIWTGDVGALMEATRIC